MLNLFEYLEKQQIPKHTFVAGACECGVAFGMTEEDLENV